MDRELCEALKAAGFPQNLEVGDWLYDHNDELIQSQIRIPHTSLPWGVPWVKVPSRAALIEACGPSDLSDEELARQWLALNKKEHQPQRLVF